jgi:hypothetical protein
MRYRHCIYPAVLGFYILISNTLTISPHIGCKHAGHKRGRLRQLKRKLLVVAGTAYLNHDFPD